MEKSHLVIVAIASIALLAVTGCATKVPVQKETVVLQEQAEPVEESAPVEPQPEDPCTTIQAAVARAEQLSRVSFYEGAESEDTIHFEFDSDALSAEAKATLDGFVAQLKEGNSSFLELQGHTDDFGSESYNFELGLARARAAMGYLYGQHGIPLQRMNSFSCGKSRPVADNASRTGRAVNRRVTFVVIE